MGINMDNFKPIYTESQRKAKTRKEIRRLNGIFEHIDERNRKTVEHLIENAAFLYVTLEETQKIIARDGIIEEYQNGANQKGIKKSSAVEVYDKSLNTYSKIIKQLCDLLPEGKGEDDPTREIMDFIKAGPR